MSAHTMDETGTYIVLAVLGLAAVITSVMAWEWRREKHSIQIAEEWPAIEATVESGALESVTDSSARSPIILPVFAFSYQVDGNYYSGRFALSHLNTDANDLIRRMIGRKLLVRCNPSSPNVWMITETEIEGCRVEQKMGPHVLALYPRE